MIANECSGGGPQSPNGGRKSVTVVARREVKIRKPENLGLWIEFLIKVSDFMNWLLWRAMTRWQVRQFKRELEQQRAEWN